MEFVALDGSDTFEDCVVADAFPYLVLVDILEHGKDAQQITRNAKDGWVVRFEFPGGVRSLRGIRLPDGGSPPLKPLEYHLTSDGALHAIHRPGWGESTTLEYAEVAGWQMRVARSVDRGGWELVDVSVSTSGEPSDFAPDAVFERARRRGILDQVIHWSIGDLPPAEQLGAEDLGSNELDDAEGGEAPPPLPEPMRRRVTWPLVGVGAVFLAAGAYAWLRQRNS